MAPQRLEKIESAPGNGMGSEASDPQDLVRRLTVRNSGSRASRMTKIPVWEVAEKGAERSEFARCRTEIGSHPRGSAPHRRFVERASRDDGWGAAEPIDSVVIGRRLSLLRRPGRDRAIRATAPFRP